MRATYLSGALGKTILASVWLYLLAPATCVGPFTLVAGETKDSPITTLEGLKGRRINRV